MNFNDLVYLIMGELKNCLICGIEFIPKTTGKYCRSKECLKKLKSINNKKYHNENKEKINTKRKEHYIQNLEWYKKRDRKKWEDYKKENPNIKSKRDLSHLNDEERKEVKRKSWNKYRRERYKVDELYNLKTRFRSLLNNKIREKGFIKSQSTLKYLGCDWKTFKEHIQSQFKDGMTWENRSLWDLDHVIPISEGKTKEDFILLSHYTNFQPLWREDNIKKSNTW